MNNRNGALESVQHDWKEKSGEVVHTAPIGRILQGRYQLKRLLGEGGMGGVYEAEHLEIGKRVAIKLVHALHATDQHIAARIKQEARSTGAIESEHIVQVFDAGEDPSMGLYLVMELLKGEDLSSLLAREKCLIPATAAMIVAQAAQGLYRAHATGIVHRDLKPANIFIVPREDGSTLVKLVDFGIAKLVRDANRQREGHGLTRTGMVIGTPQYMSPEQAQGLPSVDHRTDIYSLGAVLYEIMVGTSPFPEMPTYEQTILQIMTRPAPRLSQMLADIPPELDQLCADMMAMNPDDRPRNMQIVRERLLAIFPAIQSARMPMSSVSRVGLETSLTGSFSVNSEVRQTNVRTSRSGSGTAIMGPASEAILRSSDNDQDVVAIPGVGGGRRNLLFVGGAFLILALGAALATLGFSHSHTGNEDPHSGSAHTANPEPTNETLVTPPTLVLAPIPSAATSEKTLAPHQPQVAVPIKKPAILSVEKTKSAPTTPAREKTAAVDSAPARPVGGTGVATEF